MTERRNAADNSTKSFQGLRVLDFSTTIAGPHCTRMLADMGAEVIKIESAEGETMRTRPPLRNGFSTVFGQLNVGKKSLVLDLKSPDAIEVIRRLVASADILVENFRPGRDAKIEAGLRLAARAQSEADLLFDLRIRPDRAVGGTAGLRARSSMPPRVTIWPTCRTSRGEPGRTIAAFITPTSLTGVYAFGAISAALYQRHGSQSRSAHRRLDAGIDAQPDPE